MTCFVDIILRLLLNTYIPDFSHPHGKALKFRWNGIFDLSGLCRNKNLNTVSITYPALTNSTYAIDSHPLIRNF